MAQVTKTGFLVKNCYRKSIQIADSLDIMKANVHPVQIIQRLSRRKMVEDEGDKWHFYPRAASLPPC